MADTQRNAARRRRRRLFASSDPEPEFVDINDDDLAVVSLQENNHLAVVDLESGNIVNAVSAGEVDEVPFVDATEDELGPQETGVISLTESVEDRRREPDADAWVDDDTFATANEGDDPSPPSTRSTRRPTRL